MNTSFQNGRGGSAGPQSAFAEALAQKSTREMCKQLEEETGIQSWTENGGLFVACNQERLDEYVPAAHN